MVSRRIQSGDYHEWLAQQIGLIIQGNLRFAHGLQEAALGFGGRPIDLVGQYDIGEGGTGHELERLLLMIDDRRADNVGWQQIARKLDAVERAVQRSCKTMSQRGLFPGCLQGEYGRGPEAPRRSVQ